MFRSSGGLTALVFVGAVAGLAACSPAAEKAAAPVDATPHMAAATPVDAGRYLVLVGGCNDCHTAGFAPSGGKIPEAQQLLGSPIGYHGPWGTSYAANLRMLVQNTTEDGWVDMMRTKPMLPPMPIHSLAKMNEADLRAMYQYIHSLGGGGQPEPENLPPGQKPAGPYEDMTIIGLPPGPPPGAPAT